MALLTAAELKASREAIEAGVFTVSDPDADAAIAEATAELYALLGHRIEVTDVSFTFRGTGKSVFYLPQRARSVTQVTEDGTVTNAAVYHLANRGWLLKRESGTWAAETVVVAGTFGFVAADDAWVLSKKAVRLLAVRYLQSTSALADLPGGAPGAYLTSYSSQGADFSFFTPDSGVTGYPDVDRLIEMIRENTGWPFNSKKVLISVPLTGSSGDPRPYVES